MNTEGQALDQKLLRYALRKHEDGKQGVSNQTVYLCTKAG